MHDASEAYLVDVATPVKRHPAMMKYREAERNLMKAICTRFDLPVKQPASVRPADLALLSTEYRDLMIQVDFWNPPVKALKETIVPWDWQTAEKEFLARFNELRCPIKQLEGLIKALGSYNAAPTKLKQGCSLEVEDLAPIMKVVTYSTKRHPKKKHG
jgi:hypothetical protein